MSATSSGTGPAVIVVAERTVSDLLAGHGVHWTVQDRQGSIAAMWDALSGGRLDAQSRILVFSDSLLDGTPSADTELIATARAIVAMSAAGAHVFVALWRPEGLEVLQAAIAQAAVAQRLDPQRLPYTFLPVVQGGRAVLDTMRRVLDGEVEFPDDYRPDIDAPLAREGFSGSRLWQEAAAATLPSSPSVVTTPAASTHAVDVGAHAVVPESDVPAQASADLLARPRPAGQTTITVTSSKGGSGKSTCALLLAGAIATSSRDAGAPLSVCLVDMDTRDGQVASLIGRFMPTALNIRVQPVWDEEAIRRHVVRDELMGIDTVLAPIRPRTADAVGAEFYRAIIRSLKRMYDVVIMDTSVQYLDPLIADVCLPEADEVLFVTTLASTAVQGMARALREITAPVDESGMGVPRERIGIVVNQSVADVGMERDQVLAAGLGVPVVGVIPLATKDVLTATNLTRMSALLDHPLLGPAYNELARVCLPGRDLMPWRTSELVGASAAASASGLQASDADGRRRGLFRR